jgi:hypothetical protein
MMLPWFVSSFICVLDFGFCAYSMIATQNAARAAAEWGAASSSNYAAIISGSTACTYAAPAFKYAPTPVTACGNNLSVTATEPSPSGMPVVQVAVTYTVNLLSLPPLMPGSLAITRTVQMPIRY